MNKIITINREFGSGGRELAKRLAQKLGFQYLDHEIVSEMIKRSNFDEKYIESIDKIGNDDFPYTISKSFGFYSAHQKQATDVLVLERKIIRQMAQSSNCVFVGRGADIILEEFQPLKIFVYADLQSKLSRCKAKAPKDENLSDKQILRHIKQIDKSRKKHHLLLGCDTWGKKEGYNLCINTSNIEIKTLVDVATSFADIYFKENKN